MPISLKSQSEYRISDSSNTLCFSRDRTIRIFGHYGIDWISSFENHFSKKGVWEACDFFRPARNSLIINDQIFSGRSSPPSPPSLLKDPESANFDLVTGFFVR